ncbi:MAG TPA: hypothetical protein VIL20_14585 [Sandaracinaceae bacterium]
MGYRDELEALRARLAVAERDRDLARAEVERLKRALGSRMPTRQRTPDDVPAKWRSIPGGEPTPLTVINESRRKLEVFWLSYDGRPRSAGTLVGGGRIRTQTYVGHCWRFTDAETGEILQHTFVRVDAGEPVIVYREGSR